MRDGADHLLAVEYDCDTKCMYHVPHMSSRAVHRSRDCARLKHDGRVPFSEDLPAAEHGNIR